MIGTSCTEDRKYGCVEESEKIDHPFIYDVRTQHSREDGADRENSPIKHIPIGPPCSHKSVMPVKTKAMAIFRRKKTQSAANGIRRHCK